jgi:PLP dependent protein
VRGKKMETIDAASTALSSVAQRLASVRERVCRAEQDAGRPVGSVQILAVSKTRDASQIRAAWAADQRAFGESYLQEALNKMDPLGDLDLEWHFIGRVQANKTRALAERFAWVHGLSDIHHARRLNAQRPAELPPLNLCIQVNVSQEPSKGGVAPEAVQALLAQCQGLPRICVRGLMAIPEPITDQQRQHEPFARLRRLRDRLRQTDLPLDTLSMGMSNDLEAAIAEGATLVRIGTAIFGSRI